MDIFDPSTYPPILWWSGVVINFVLIFFLGAIVMREDRTIGFCLMWFMWSAVFASMWPVIDGIVLLVFGTAIICGLLSLIFTPIERILTPILNRRI